MFEALKKGGKTVGVTNLPHVMVESFLREYLDIDFVVGREMKVFCGYYVGLMEDTKTMHALELVKEGKGCLYVPRWARNLVYVARLDALGFNFKIGNNEFSLFKDMYCYGSSTLIDGLYCFNLVAKFMKSLFNVECIVGMVVSVMCMVKVLLICGIKD